MFTASIISGKEPIVRWVRDFLARQAPAWEVWSASTLEELTQTNHVGIVNLHVVELEANMPGEPPYTQALQPLMETLGHHSPYTPVVVLVPEEPARLAADAVRTGANDVLTKPLSEREAGRVLLPLTRHIEEQSQLGGLSVEGWDYYFLSRSPQMLAVFNKVLRAARCDSPILLTGESGTGKNVLAECVHHLSQRNQQRFVPISCANIERERFESELFGHKKGAYTGAVESKRGLLKMAHQGTAFLDEIGTMPKEVQAKLLKCIDEQTFRPMGMEEEVHVDVRIVAATKEDMVKMVEEGTFWDDLYYRLSDIEIHLPPLRERMEDLPGLVDHLRQKLNQQEGKQIHKVAAGAMRKLQSFTFPGNLRQLEQILRGAFRSAPGSVIRAEHIELKKEIKNPASRPDTPINLDLPFDQFKDENEKRYLEALLARFSYDYKQAMEHAQIKESSFYNLLRKHKLRRKDRSTG